MYKSTLLWLLLGISVTLHSQSITIKDSISGEPLEMATLMSQKPRAFSVTNTAGQADISGFRGSEVIEIRSLGYKTLMISYKEIQELEFLILISSSPTQIGGLVIRADLWGEQKLEAPNRIEKIDMKEAAFQNPQTTADLLGMSGYAFIQKSQLGGGSPMLRGFAANRVLLVVDGVRMNTAIFRSGNVQNVISVDANAVESSEILFGPGSVMYGSDAIGGVMCFNTLKTLYSGNSTGKPLVTGNGMSRFSSANMENSHHVDVSFGLKKLAFTSSFTWSDYGDLRSGSKGGVDYFYRPSYVLTLDNKDYMVPNEDSTLQIGSEYSQINVMQKISYRPAEFLELDYGFHFSETSKYNRYDRLYVMQTSGPYKEKLRWAEWYYGPQKWQMHRFGVTFSRPCAIFDEAKLVTAYQFFEESRYDREFMVRELRMQKEQVNAWSVNLDFDKQLAKKVALSYGIESLSDRVHSVANLTHVVKKEVYPTVTRYPDGSTWKSNGIYLTAKYELNPRWSFSAGVRYSRFSVDAEFDTTWFPFPFTEAQMRSGSPGGSLGSVFSPSESWQIYLNAATGFRAPNIDDMGKVFESVPGYLVVPNPDLKPEYVYNLETGTLKTFGDFVRLDFAGYYTWLVDAMVRKDFVFNGDTTIRYQGNKSRVQAIQNVAGIRVYGIQAGLEISYRGLGLRSDFSWQKGKEQTPDSLVYYPLRHAAPLFGTTHLTFDHQKFKIDFYAVYNAKMDYEDLALTERENASYARDEKGLPYVAGWYTLNFKAAFYPKQYVSFTLGVENICDRMYRPYGSGINAPGRNFIASFRVRF
jgi:hemoglobin/transferrin/lactoferrin receptor protein